MVKVSYKALRDLEFPRVIEQLSAFCVTKLGKEKVLNIKPFTQPKQTLFALHQTQEYKSSALEDASIPQHGFDHVNEEIQLLDIENSMLTLRGFQKIAALSRTANTHIAFFKKHRSLYPNLYKTTDSVEHTKVLIKSIQEVINRFGEVKDKASPQLESVRQSLRNVEAQINSSFQADMATYQKAGYLDEIKESMVGNDRVLAVSAAHQRKVKGRILGRSNTGRIVFIQPENTLQFSRKLNTLKYEEKEEINRILSKLTEIIRPYRYLLIDYQKLLAEIDLTAAKVKYGARMNAVLPKISKTQELDLKEAYHPLLYLTNKESGATTFPQDLKLNRKNRIVVISGPNAGGKSITLKTIGLLQVMLQSGLLIPAHEYSRMSFFSTILSDIGDHQSIENHLSTYSYRLKNMQHFLRKCDDNTLFLIDEFGTGSDPELGGALAETFLEVFYERKSFGVITTHYANLKKMADETEGISNANMRFNHHNLEPEFKLQLGEAGSSFTFEVAQKNGIPYRLINRSKKKVNRGKIRFDKNIAKLQQERHQLQSTKTKLQSEKLSTAEHKKSLAHKNNRIQQKLEDYQELYDHNQHLINLGQKIDRLGRDYGKSHNKKRLIGEVLKLVAKENSKRKTQGKNQQKRHQKAKQDAEKQARSIREKKREESKKEAKNAETQRQNEIKSFNVNDRVRLQDSQAVGTIDHIEKGRAFINYGQFTTQAPLEKLELVKAYQK